MDSSEAQKKYEKGQNSCSLPFVKGFFVKPAHLISLFTIAGSSISRVATVTGACVRPICIMASCTAITLTTCRTLVHILKVKEKKTS